MLLGRLISVTKANDLDREYMRLALTLAASACGSTSPNPMVGAVIVRRHQVVGTGVHLKAGEAHAEVHALHMAKEQANGATLYVTLEPCSHYGRTPPCVDQVIRAGIQRVVIATLDPNPLVAGRGVKKLKEAGLRVDVGVLEEESKQMNEIYNHYIVHRRPFVTLKTATTLDGRIATVTGESKWITSDEARADAHRLRHQHDAILVGVGTVLKDNPRLTTRLGGLPGRHPVRVVLDSKLSTPTKAHLVQTNEAPTWIFTTRQADPTRMSRLQDHGVRVIQTEDERRLSIDRVLKFLGDEGIASLLVEGGGEVNASFLEGKHVHKWVAYLAPKLIGGDKAPGAFRGKGFARLADALQLKNVQYVPVGPDLKIVGYFE